MNDVLAISGARVYPSAAAQPLDNATVLIRGRRIVAVVQRVQIPPHAKVIRCDGCVVMAGFWNTHIHFTETKWDAASAQPAPELQRKLHAMLTSHGFTTVVDTASDLQNTLALRRRIESGEIAGPRIFTAGSALYPPSGIPYYLKETAPAELTRKLSAPDTPEKAESLEKANIQNGADLLKLFTGSWIERGRVMPMPLDIAKAAADVAHRHRQLVFAHCSNLAGIQVTMASGVDVIAHAPDETAGITGAVIQSWVDHHMALIPTLKLFSGSNNIAQIRDIVRQFHDRRGQLLFGTDTGFLTDYDIAEEYSQLAQAGLTTAGIIGMLTENPAAKFGILKDHGRVAPGMRADLTILDSDPSADLRAFTRVRYTIRDGRVIYARP